MPNKQVKLINFQQQGVSNLLFPRAALLTSYNAKWTDIHFELHQQPVTDTGEHHQPMHIISTTLGSGLAERWMNGRFEKEFLKEGSIAIVPADVLHRSVWHQEASFMFVAISPAQLATVGQELVKADRIELIPHFATVQDPLIQGILFSLKDELESGGVGGRLYVDQLKTTLAFHLLRKYCTCTPRIANYSNGLPPYKLKEAIAYINEHLGENVSLEDLATQLDMSQYHFCRLFKQSMGIAPYKYLMQQRIEQAKVLLKQKGVAISDIAAQVGFVDQSHFTKYFRQLTGITPKAYRQEKLEC